jgi:hypothetical protein
LHSTLLGLHSSNPELVPAAPPAFWLPALELPAAALELPAAALELPAAAFVLPAAALVLPAAALDSPAALPPTWEPAPSAPAPPADPTSSPLLPQADPRQNRVLPTRKPNAEARMSTVYTNQALEPAEAGRRSARSIDCATRSSKGADNVPGSATGAHCPSRPRMAYRRVLMPTRQSAFRAPPAFAALQRSY